MALRTSDSKQLAAQSCDRLREIGVLLSFLQELVQAKEKDFAAMRSTVDAIFAISPNDRRVRGLDRQLRDQDELQQRKLEQLEAKRQEQENRRRRKSEMKALELEKEARSRFMSFDYEGCLSSLAEIEESLISHDSITLGRSARERLSRVAILKAEIKTAVTSEVFDGLIVKIDELLAIANDSSMRKLREQVPRLQEKASLISDAINNACILRSRCDFRAAANRLQQLPQEWLEGRAANLLKSINELDAKRMEATLKLRTAMKDRNYSVGVMSSVSVYNDSIGRIPLVDREFQDLYHEYQRQRNAAKGHLLERCSVAVDIIKRIDSIDKVLAAKKTPWWDGPAFGCSIGIVYVVVAPVLFGVFVSSGMYSYIACMLVVLIGVPVVVSFVSDIFSPTVRRETLERQLKSLELSSVVPNWATRNHDTKYVRAEVLAFMTASADV